jgi:hypothetical protein
MQFQLIMGLVITGLVVLYVYLKRTAHNEKNLPVVLEDVNLPAVSQPNPPTIKNELDNKGPQQ